MLALHPGKQIAYSKTAQNPSLNHTPIEYAIIKDHKHVLKLLLSFPMKGIMKKKALNLALAKPSYTMAFKIYKWRTACIIFDRVVWGCFMFRVVAFTFIGIYLMLVLLKTIGEYYCLQMLGGACPTTVLCKMVCW